MCLCKPQIPAPAHHYWSNKKKQKTSAQCNSQFPLKDLKIYIYIFFIMVKYVQRAIKRSSSNNHSWTKCTSKFRQIIPVAKPQVTVQAKLGGWIEHTCTEMIQLLPKHQKKWGKIKNKKKAQILNKAQWNNLFSRLYWSLIYEMSASAFFNLMTTVVFWHFGLGLWSIACFVMYPIIKWEIS